MMPIDIYDAAHIPKSLSIRSCVPVAQWIGTLPFHYDAVNSLYYDAMCRTCFAQICLEFQCICMTRKVANGIN